MDNLQPMMLNAATDGKAWVEHGVHLAQIMKRNEHTAEYSETLMEYAREMLLRLLPASYFFIFISSWDTNLRDWTSDQSSYSASEEK